MRHQVIEAVIRGVIFKINYALNTHCKLGLNKKGAKATYKPLEVLGQNMNTHL
jgi:hypothetical protein